MRLFFTGFLQVFFVGLVTVFISKGFVPGMFVCSFFISWLWVANVRSVKPHHGIEQYIYALGAATGTVTAYFTSGLILIAFNWLISQI